HRGVLREGERPGTISGDSGTLASGGPGPTRISQADREDDKAGIFELIDDIVDQDQIWPPELVKEYYDDDDVFHSSCSPFLAQGTTLGRPKLRRGGIGRRHGRHTGFKEFG